MAWLMLAGMCVISSSTTAPSRGCPRCRGPLVFVGIREVRVGAGESRRRRAYWCQTGCRGAEPDGMFEFIECPACGSDDTTFTPRADGVQELACSACGTITSLEMVCTLL